MHELLIPFALVATVLMVSGLVSGVVRRAPISVPIIFLGLGLLLGDGGLGFLHVDVHDEALEVVGVLSLAFVLFLDAVNLRFDEGERAWLVPMLAIGPGTILTVALVALGAGLILHTSPVESLLLGAVLASIDPVVLRDVVRDDRVPRSIRQALTAEAGTNDIVVLPLILVLATIARGAASSTADWLALVVRLFILGPLTGAAVGFVSVWLIEQVRSRFPISREYRALYGVGTVLAAYVAGEAVGGSGFLAVFAAGAVVVATDFDLCDCFLEYGEITAEMLMLLAFILFGALLSSLAGTVPLLPALLFAAVVLVVARPVAIGLVLRKAGVSKHARLFMGWFGPRGLASLLFALLVVSQGVPGADRLLAITGIVVIASVVAHGVSATPLIAAYGRAISRQTLPEERETTATGLFGGDFEEAPRVTPEQLAAMLAGDNPPIVLDVRTSSARASGNGGIPGSVRVPPGDVADWAARQPRNDTPVVAYCT
jgi:NhaP-type Na+/H+ or K+/H+ antiporter